MYLHFPFIFTAPIQNLLRDSFYQLETNQQHLQENKCRPQCPWNCIPLQLRQKIYQLVDQHLHSDTHFREYQPMAEAFGISDYHFDQICKYQSRDPSLSATIIKVLYLQNYVVRIHKRVTGFFVSNVSTLALKINVTYFQSILRVCKFF